eukprot:Gregarina_sp_Poly_1__2286@NODE_1608_length_3719_cov_22_234940_g1060_i0_p1_GENE_NODE_1608_length_3719_cov_22_234940_g1060_i0NODE_1608_length_3719_cov_22_234940_g1060_i0_p1_ORF_typecomplete_len610_score108_50SGT1/PF07093_11/1_5e09_NODE_1608_length_3719_cov_22_234940_g1060_i04142243
MDSLEYIFHGRTAADFDWANAWLFVDGFYDGSIQECRKILQAKLAMLIEVTRDVFDNHVWALSPPSWQVASLQGFGEKDCLGIKLSISGEISLEDEWFLVQALQSVTKNVASLHDVSVLFWDNDGDFLASVLLADDTCAAKDAKFELPTSLYLRRGIVRKIPLGGKSLAKKLFMMQSLSPWILDETTTTIERKLASRLRPFTSAGQSNRFFGHVSLGAVVPIHVARLLSIYPHLSTLCLGHYLGFPASTSAASDTCSFMALGESPMVLTSVAIPVAQAAHLSSCKARRMPLPFLLRSWPDPQVGENINCYKDEDLRSFKLVGSRLTFALNELLMVKSDEYDWQGVLHYSKERFDKQLINHRLKTAPVLQNCYIAETFGPEVDSGEFQFARLQDELNPDTLQSAYYNFGSLRTLLEEKVNLVELLTASLAGADGNVWQTSDINALKPLSDLDGNESYLEEFLQIISGGDSSGIKKIMGFGENDELFKESLEAVGENLTNKTSNVLEGLDFKGGEDLDMAKILAQLKELGIDEENVNDCLEEASSSADDDEGEEEMGEDALQTLQRVELEDKLLADCDTKTVAEKLVEAITLETRTGIGPTSLLISEIYNG